MHARFDFGIHIAHPFTCVICTRLGASGLLSKSRHSAKTSSFPKFCCLPSKNVLLFQNKSLYCPKMSSLSKMLSLTLLNLCPHKERSARAHSNKHTQIPRHTLKLNPKSQNPKNVLLSSKILSLKRKKHKTAMIQTHKH